MPTYQNWHVYRRDALDLQFIATKLAADPKSAVEAVSIAPGQFVVIDSNFDEIATVRVNLKATTT